MKLFNPKHKRTTIALAAAAAIAVLIMLGTIPVLAQSGPLPPKSERLNATVQANSVFLTWQGSTDPALLHYTVKRAGPIKTGTETYQVLSANTGSKNASFRDSTITSGETYYYKVATANSHGTGEYSNRADIAVPQKEQKRDNQQNIVDLGDITHTPGTVTPPEGPSRQDYKFILTKAALASMTLRSPQQEDQPLLSQTLDPGTYYVTFNLAGNQEYNLHYSTTPTEITVDTSTLVVSPTPNENINDEIETATHTVSEADYGRTSTTANDVTVNANNPIQTRYDCRPTPITIHHGTKIIDENSPASNVATWRWWIQRTGDECRDRTIASVTVSSTHGTATLFMYLQGNIFYKVNVSAPNFEALTTINSLGHFRVSMTATNDIGESATRSRNIYVTDLEETETISLSPSSATSGSAITASLTGGDGITGTPTWSWSIDGTSAGTGSSFTPSHDDIGKTLTVSVTYTDTHPGTKTLTKNVGTVADGRPLVNISFASSSYTVTEGSTTTVTANLDADPERTVTVPLVQTLNGGISSDDYSGIPASITFSSGETQKSFTFTAVDDDIDDDDESVNLAFGTLPDRVTAGSSATINITDNDDPEVTVSFGAASYSIPEGSNRKIYIYLDADPERSVTIPLAQTLNGGISSQDYSGVPNSVTISSGETGASFTFTATQDTVDDDSESVRVAFGDLPDRVTAGSPDETVLSINDDDYPHRTVRFGQSSYAISENGATATVTVRLSGRPERSVTIPIIITHNNGASVADYSGITTNLGFSSNQTQRSFTVRATDDYYNDDGESLTLSFGTLPTRMTTTPPSTTGISITDNDEPDIILSNTSITMNEGTDASYTAKLNTRLTEEVTVAISGYADTPISLDTTSLTFITSTWNTPQTVTLTATDDEDAVIPPEVTLSHEASGDVYDDQTEQKELPIYITETDTAGVTLSNTSLTIQEGDSDTYTVELNSQPTAEVIITVNDPSNTDITTDTDSLTFTDQDWNTPRTVTISTVDDDDAPDDYGTITHTITSTAVEYQTTPAQDSSQPAVAAPDVQVSVTDPDEPEIVLSKTPITMDEGTNETYTIRLDTEPTEQVTVEISGYADTPISLDRTSLTFTTSTWNTPQTVTLTATDDEDAIIPPLVTLSHDASGGDYEDEEKDLPIYITETDTAGFTMSNTSLTIQEGDSDTYTVELDSQPTAEVIITVNDPSNTDITTDTNSLTFTDQDWNNPRTITISTIDDDDAPDDYGTITHTITSTAVEYQTTPAQDNPYPAVAAPDVHVSVTDPDEPEIVLSKTPITMDEGTNETYTVRLDTEPTEEVILAITGYADTPISLDTTSLTFTTSTWNTPQTVTLTAADDRDAVVPDNVTLNHDASGGDYADEEKNLTVSITETDQEGVTITPTTLDMMENDSQDYTVVLTSQPLEDVDIMINIPSGAELKTTRTSQVETENLGQEPTEQEEEIDKLTFTPDNWNTQQTVNVKALDDDDGKDETDTDITHETNTTDILYNELGNLDKVTIKVTDDDDPYVIVSFASSYYSVGEGHRKTITVRLDTDPERTIDIPITKTYLRNISDSDFSEIPTSITFSSEETQKSFTFRATQDTIDDDNEKLRLGFGTLPERVSSGSPSTTTISINDDDDPYVTVRFGSSSHPVDEGSSGTITVRLNANPERAIDIPITKTYLGDISDSDFSGVPSTITFSSGETQKSFQFTATQDTIDDDNEKLTLSFGALPNRVSSGSPSTSTISVNDDDDAVIMDITPLDTRVTEGETITIRFTRAGTSSQPQTFTAAIAETGNFTEAASVDVTFQPADTTADAEILTMDDQTWEEHGRITVIQGTESTSVEVQDNDFPTTGMTISVDKNPTTENAGSITITVKANTDAMQQPHDSRSFKLRTTDGTATADQDYADTMNTLQFSPNGFTSNGKSNYSATKTTQIGIMEDSNQENDETFEIWLMPIGDVSPAYVKGQNPVTVTIQDNPIPTKPSRPIGGDPSPVLQLPQPTPKVIASTDTITMPQGAKTSYTLVLNTPPTQNVTVTPSPTTNAPFSTSPQTLTFKESNWNTPQTVTVIAPTTTVRKSAARGQILHQAIGGNYNNAYTDTVNITVTYTPTNPRIIVEPSSITMDPGQQQNYTVSIDSPPYGEVVITITPPENSGIQVNPHRFTIDHHNWLQQTTVEITGSIAGAFNVRHQASGGGYNAAPETTLSLNIKQPQPIPPVPTKEPLTETDVTIPEDPTPPPKKQAEPPPPDITIHPANRNQKSINEGEYVDLELRLSMPLPQRLTGVTIKINYEGDVQITPSTSPLTMEFQPGSTSAKVRVYTNDNTRDHPHAKLIFRVLPDNRVPRQYNPGTPKTAEFQVLDDDAPPITATATPVPTPLPPTPEPTPRPTLQAMPTATPFLTPTPTPEPTMTPTTASTPMPTDTPTPKPTYEWEPAPIKDPAQKEPAEDLWEKAKDAPFPLKLLMLLLLLALAIFISYHLYLRRKTRREFPLPSPDAPEENYNVRDIFAPEPDEDDLHDEQR